MALAGAALVSIAVADGTGSNKGLRGRSRIIVGVRTNAAESGLIGVRLYDTGLRVIQLYGSPDEVQDVLSGAGQSVGPAVNPGGRGGGGGGNGRGGGGGGGVANQAEWNIPGLDYHPINFAQEPPPRIGGAGGAGGTAPQQGGSGGGGGGGQAPQAGGGGGGTAGGPTENRVVYTRWVYRRGNSRYAFILNRYNQVIQIEAIGMNDPRVVTNRGIRYGAQFADIMNRYGAPDGYEIGGNSLVMRYLVNNKVAFRLNRLKTDGKHVVTGIVVAAGKM